MATIILPFQMIRLIGLTLLLTTLVSTEAENLQKQNKCPDVKECPFKPESCNEDDDCNPDSSCCDSPCGKICTKQISTGCQMLHKATSRRAKALGVDIKSVRTPRCKQSGSFETIQCDNEIVSSCWCVDEQGFELPGTRAPAAALVNCTDPKPCASHTCRMFCPYGFALDVDSCPLCRCRDPCDNIRCPNALDCQLEELACLDPPCPPIPTCKRGRSLDNICPLGDPLRITDTVRPFLCGNEPSKPSCPPLYRCLVQSGNDYGVCCPASLKLQKAGMCPVDDDSEGCGSLCTHDLECPSVQKCCTTKQCVSSCIHPKNVTECYHQKALSELLAVNERMGRGYVPQCNEVGEFEPKQCSRNGLVCWCVNKKGSKIKGSMGPSEHVNCSLIDFRNSASGRSIDRVDDCEKMECAAVCEYGFKLDDTGCPTCKCDDPCEGYTCPEDEECVAVRDASCTDFLCPTLPVCRPKTVYVNPCKQGSPLTNDISGTPISCSLRTEEDGAKCPVKFECTAVAGSTQSVCCPLAEPENEQEANDDSKDEYSSDYEKPPTMCVYLRSFTENMEGTREGMTIALPQPICDSEGNYVATQCDKDVCWCVDQFGTEIFNSRVKGVPLKNCTELRSSIDCLDLTCRMGCDYGFVLEQETGCPTCQCRDPCQSIKCNNDQQCQMVEVSCKDHYCPPVPACLPKKTGQCPYLVPPVTTSCNFECNSDSACNGTERCCSNGCGTQCTEPLLMSACQHQRAIAQYQAHESGIPAGRFYVPLCKEDGSYNSLQCNHGKQKCWCVDFSGFEISQTRTSSDKELDCESKSYSGNCPLYNCVNNCEHGYELDQNGCRTCNCIDPCASLVCRNDGEICRLVHVECVDWPCPSVPMCLPKKENPCQSGEALKLTGSQEAVSCGPDYESCPSSHKCQLSPLGEYAVCCPKPRDVCFEPMDQGYCSNSETTRNLTRFHFNSKINKCERFIYLGCQGNHNNFHSEDMCNIVCPVLSQCERLREKNKRVSERYKKPTFAPRCEKATGIWEPVQCMEYVGVCWCVNPQGEHLKGTLTRGKEPECNFRQARGHAMDNTERVLEEVMVQLATINYYDPMDNSINNLELPLESRCEILGAQCDQNGKFNPSQCDQDQCWCVDEAGNQLPHTSTFKKGEHSCLPTPVEYVDVTIGLRGEYNDVSSLSVANNLRKVIKHLHGTIKSDKVITELISDVLYVKFALVGSNKVDVAYRLEQMMAQQQLPEMTADITRSRFIHQISTQNPSAERIIAFQHREIVSQSPVSMLAPYHTAFIVVAAASAFIICVLTLLVVLYRYKMTKLSTSANKVTDGPQRFLPTSLPIYIELPNEQLTPPSTRQDKV